MEITKNKNVAVVKPFRGGSINLVKKGKGDAKDEDIVLLTVVDQDGDTVKTFAKSDHGPRFWFKAKQFADQNSNAEIRLSIKELE